jgi:hypothetical protein
MVFGKRYLIRTLGWLINSKFSANVNIALFVSVTLPDDLGKKLVDDELLQKMAEMPIWGSSSFLVRLFLFALLPKIIFSDWRRCY